MQTKILGYINRVIIPNLFFFFFVAQIFSPYIFGVTLYLEVVIALLDANFFIWLLRGKKKPLFAILLILPILFMRPSISIKLLCLIISVSYLKYSYLNNCFLLKQYFLLSIFVAIAQFALYYTIPELSIVLGPQNISEYIWGEYATITNTNFYEAITGIIRVSGLSREAGFFASLLNCVVLYYYLECRTVGIKLSWAYKFFLFLAYIISFSKMSLLLFPMLIIISLRKQINTIPVYVILSLFYFIQLVVWYHSQFLLTDGNETFTHRFGAYGILPDYNNIIDLIFGVKEVTYHQFTGTYAKQYFEIIEGLGPFGGMGAYIVYNGIVLTVLLFALLIHTGISSTGLLLLLLLTINVQLDTNQNFVVLAYFIVFKYFLVNRINIKTQTVYESIH